MKKTIKILVWIVAVLAVAFFALEMSLGKVVQKGVNAAAPAALGVPVTLQGADISLIKGAAALTGLHVGNPEGYKTDGLLDLASISVDIDNSTLLADTLVIKNIAIDGLVLTYEKGLLNSNIGALLDQLSAGKEEQPQEKAEEKTKAEPQAEKPGKKVVIETLSFRNCQMKFSVTGVAALTGGGALPIPLPIPTIHDIGKEKNGATIPEVIQHVLTAISGAAGTVIAGSAKLLGQGAEAVGEGAMAVGEGAVDAGKAVVGGATDAGKAVVGGAVDAGKAVGDAVGGALKNINPFGK